ncbi:MAG: glycoside hydrolase family 3 C-terminal domain-containing protein [Anaerolineaceae bacterium]|nr:glycoside hydrolase family 3 C-terminal domain-containing protein [Anaerolineaceae bacterium]
MTGSAKERPIYKNPLVSIPERVEDLLSRMSPEQKLAQLNCNHLTFMQHEQRLTLMGQGMGHLALSISSGTSIEQNIDLVEQAQRFLVNETELGIPAIVHCEALSGAMLVGATNFPSPIALAATWDSDSVEAMGRVISKQLVPLGIRHILSPVMDVARDPRWGRIGETYGEDPTLSARMSVAFVKGVQGENLKNGVAATGKHFLGYAMTEGAMNTTSERIAPRDLLEVYAKPFAAAIQDAHLAAVMNSYSTLDGIPITASPEILTDLLRGELGFDGMVISDYGSINKLVVPLNIVSDYTEAGLRALQAGMDVEAPEIATYGKSMLDAVETGKLPMAILDRSVRRVLELKFRLGLFENPYPNSSRISIALGQTADEALSYQLAQEAIVLLENRASLLPISTELRNVAVIGPCAKDLRNLFGSYSYAAALEVSDGVGTGPQTVDIDGDVASQKAAEPDHIPASLEDKLASLYPNALTVYDAIVKKISDASVSYAEGCGLGNLDRSGFDEAVQLSQDADLVILVVGDREGWHNGNCTMGEGMDNSDIGLPGVQEDLVKAVVATGSPVVLVNVSPRSLSSPWIAENVPAIVQAWNLGQMAGTAIADVLFGDHNPGGKLPMTAARATGQLPVYYAHQRGSGYEGRGYWPWSAPNGYMDGTDQPLYVFGHGLSYTQFAYSDLLIDTPEITGDGSVEISCVISNIGHLDGDEVVQLYMVDKLASVARPVKELVGFRRIHLKVGQSRKVHFLVQLSQLAFLNTKMTWVVEPGEIDVLVGSSSQDIRLADSFTIIGDTTEFDKNRSFYAEIHDELLVDYKPDMSETKRVPSYSLDSTVAELLANEVARDILKQHLPGLFENPEMLAIVQQVSLRKVGKITLPAFEPKRLQAVAESLAALDE